MKIEMYIPDELHFVRRSRMSTGSVVVLRGYMGIPKGLFVDSSVYLYEVLKDREHKSVSAIPALKLGGTVRVTPASCLSPLDHDPLLFIPHALYISTSPTLSPLFPPKPSSPPPSSRHSVHIRPPLHLFAFQSSRARSRSPLITSAVTHTRNNTHLSYN